MAMFVQGFWFGSKLVREGRISPGNMAVFWACLTPSSSLQMCIPQFIVLAKGKFAMATLLELVAPEPGTNLLPTVPIAPRRIRPSKYSGGRAMDHATFAYTLLVSQFPPSSTFRDFFPPARRPSLSVPLRVLENPQLPTSFRRCTNLRKNTFISTTGTCDRWTRIVCDLMSPALGLPSAISENIDEETQSQEGSTLI
jgi:hypothetical protein